MKHSYAMLCLSTSLFQWLARMIMFSPPPPYRSHIQRFYAMLCGNSAAQYQFFLTSKNRKEVKKWNKRLLLYGQKAEQCVTCMRTAKSCRISSWSRATDKEASAGQRTSARTANRQTSEPTSGRRFTNAPFNLKKT